MSDLIDREYAIKRFCEDGTYLERHGVEMMTLCEAKQRAVDLIESFPSAQFATDINVGDTINRQQAIDALDKHIDTFDAIDTNYLCGLRTAMSILKEMPSAQPETHDKRTETHACDLISRQAAIDALKSQLSDWNDDYNIPVRKSIENIERLPSAQPERKTGRWKLLYDNIWICTNCEQTEQFGVNIESTSDYCPSCGADMRVTPNELP